MPKLSTERAIGRAIASDPLIAEALAGFAASQRRRPANAAAYMVMLGLESVRWLESPRGTGTWRRGPALEEWLAQEGALEGLPTDEEPASNVVAFRPRLASPRASAGSARPAPSPIPPGGCRRPKGDPA